MVLTPFPHLLPPPTNGACVDSDDGVIQKFPTPKSQDPFELLKKHWCPQITFIYMVYIYYFTILEI